MKIMKDTVVNQGITLAIDDGQTEVLKFENDKVWVYGKELPTENCSIEVISAFLDFINFIKNKETSEITTLKESLKLAVEALEVSESEFKRIENKRKMSRDGQEMNILSDYLQGILPIKMKQKQALDKIKTKHGDL